MITVFSQRDPKWANHIYSATPPHNETIKSSGCGVTTAAMIISSLTDTYITPDQMGDYSVANGYRMDGVGTALSLFPAIAKKYGLECRLGSIDEAIVCVQNGGLVACNTYGGSTGLFSTGGHIFLMGGATGDTLEFVDPDLYSGKYDVSYRKNKATVSNGKVYVSRANATPQIAAYYLFFGEEVIDMKELEVLKERIEKLENPMIYNYIDKNMPDWARPTIQKMVDKGYLKGNEKGELNLTDELLKIFVTNDRAGLYDR